MADEMDTKPTIETVLERLSAFRNAVEAGFDKVEARFNKVEARFDKVEAEVAELRREMTVGFHKLERRFEV